MGAIKDQIDSVDTEKEVKRVQAILDSMTVYERKNPDCLDASRKVRVAKGCGVAVSEVNGLLKRFLEAKKLMKNMGKMSKFFQNPKGAECLLLWGVGAIAEALVVSFKLFP